MFTLEDLDLGAELQALSDTLGVTAEQGSDDHAGTAADADARLHPTDYFIAGA